MRRRYYIFGFAGLVLAVVWAVLSWPEKEIPEPVYKGKKVSEWLDQAAAHQTFTMEITEALQAIGTNGIPCYLHWISYEPSLLKRLGLYITGRTGGWPNVSPAPSRPKEIRAFYAFAALGELGERGAPAIPQLLAYATKHPAPLPSSPVKSPSFAIKALGMMGRPGTTAYLSLLTSEDAGVRTVAIQQSRRFSRSLYLFPEVAAQFEKLREDPDYQVRIAATNALKPWAPVATKATTP